MKCSQKLLVHYLKGCISGKYTLAQAAESTGYTAIHLCRLKKKYLQYGEDSFIHGNTLRKPHNRTPQKVRDKVAKIYATEFSGVNFNFFREELKDYYGIDLCYDTISSILEEYGQISPKSRKHRRKKEVVHEIRPRRDNEGDLLQIDGTPFPWFSWCGDQKNYCMHGGVDDATSKITSLYITENECLYGYLEILRQTYELNGGAPRNCYSDLTAIAVHTPKRKTQLTVIEQLEAMNSTETQFQRILKQFNCRQILAHSPQAKGRVERMWETVQGQIPNKFKRNKIKTIEQANEYLKKYVKEYNKRYSKPAHKADSFYVPTDLDINEILMARFPKKTDRNGCFKFHSYTFAVQDSPRKICVPCELCITDDDIKVYIHGKYWPVKILDPITDGAGESMPEVVKNICYKYMRRYAKEISA